MSQEKVEKYKEQKANRKAIMKKEKRARFVRNLISSIVLVAVVGWVGYSGVTYYIAHLPRPTADVNYTAVGDYIDGLAEEDKTEDTTSETTDESTDETTDTTAE